MASRAKRRGAADDHGGGGGGHGGASSRWLVSYADFITLMFVVFLVLFSMASVDASKYSSLARSLRQSLGPDIPPLPTRGQTGQASPVVQPEHAGDVPDVPDWPTTLIVAEKPGERVPIPPKETPLPDTKPSPKPADPVVAPPPAPPDELETLLKAVQELPGARSGLLSVALQERGLVLSIAGSVLFDPGKTTLKPEARTYLDEVSTKLKGVQFPIMVEGTADEVPVSGSGALSPWDLSALRAGAVVKYLVEQRSLPGSQFVTIGYGSGTNESGEGKTGHRVTIVVMRKRDN